jgi:hypothetical protein
MGIHNLNWRTPPCGRKKSRLIENSSETVPSLTTCAVPRWENCDEPGHQDGCNVTYEVIDLTDGRFDERKAILEPLIVTIMAALNLARR